VIFDKDNTLTAPYKIDVYNADIGAAVRESQTQFGAESVFIFSNTAGTTEDPGYTLASRLEKSLGVSVFKHKEQKPGGGEELLEYFAAQRILPHEIVVVGDRYTTDVLFGNLHGMLTIKTRILTPNGENFVVRFVRRWSRDFKFRNFILSYASNIRCS
jgi:phosphatidylglycerophosphatase GEP4